jgi:hypothetical protein
MIIVDRSFVDPYFNGNKKHHWYEESVDEHYHVSFHFDGFFKKAIDEHSVIDGNPYFNRLIDTMRPGESDRFKQWRRDNYIPENKTPCFKVLNILKKGVRSEDWSISWTSAYQPPQIKEAETLENYTEENYPYWNSVENWLYSFGIKKLLTDPNGIIAMMPISYDVLPNEYYKPYSYIVDSKNVIDYKANEYLVFKSDRKCTYTSGGRTYNNGKVLTIMTATEIWEAEQVAGVGSEIRYNLILKMQHNIGWLPAWQLGGFVNKHGGDYVLYESFISSMLPGLDKAAREMSDLDAEVIQNIFSTMWRIDGQDCNTCNGLGKVPTAQGSVVCPTCKGDGNFARSPEKEIVIKQSGLAPTSVPIPPAGYLTKPTDIVKVQDERIQNHIINALSSIGMDYIVGSLAQSGVAKQYDREEANNFVYAVYYHIVENILDDMYFFINEYRNSVVVPNYDQRQEMLPSINIPQRFDIFSEGVLMGQISAAKQANVDPLITDQMEIDLVSKYFYNNPTLRDKIVTIKSCNPLPGLTEQEKSDLLLTKAVTKEDVILSNYIVTFVEQAIEDVPGFLTMGRSEKLGILKGYAKAKLEEINPVVKPIQTSTTIIDGTQAAADVVDIEAEAKANLKGSVGGVQGILEVQRSVAQGITDPEAAIALLYEIYGFDRETASKIVGTPKPVTSTAPIQ